MSPVSWGIVNKNKGGTLAMDELVLMQDMTDSERFFFNRKCQGAGKNRTVGPLLTLFLGEALVHRCSYGPGGVGVG